MSVDVVPALPVKLPFGLRALRKLPLPRKLGFLERVYGETLASRGVAWVETAVGPTWKLDLTDPTQRWIVYGAYEGPSQMEWVMGWLREGDLVIDSGANIGQMVVYFASVARARVLAFEPLPSARAWLLECLGRYPQWNVTVRPCGLSESPQTIALQVDGARSTTRLDWYRSRALQKVEIRCERLDDVLAGVDQPVRLWKLDVEGAELSALRGARESLLARRIEAVLVEVAAGRFDELLECFRDVGFGLHRISASSGLRPVAHASQVSHGNLVAIPVETP